MTRLIYLASPYSHAIESVREARIQLSRRLARRMQRQRPESAVFSPLAWAWSVGDSIPDADWGKLTMRFLEAADEMYLIAAPGWHMSAGVTAELRYWAKIGNACPIINVTPELLSGARGTPLPYPYSIWGLGEPFTLNLSWALDPPMLDEESTSRAVQPGIAGESAPDPAITGAGSG